MDSDLQNPRHRSPNNQQHNLQQQQQQQQMNSGLMRYRSAPSSYFTNILNSVGGVDVDDCIEFLNPGPSSPIFDLVPKNLFENQQNSNSPENQAIQSQFIASMKHESEFLQQQQSQQQQQQQQQQSTDEYSSASQMIYQTPSVPKQHTLATSSSAMDKMEMENFPHMKMGGGGGGSNSNLIRHSSSPAGLFSHINVENGRLKGQTNFSSGLMTHSSGMEGKSAGLSESDDGSFSRNPGGYITGFPVNSWDDSGILSDNFLKRFGDDNRNTLENQSVEGGSRPPTMLSHHLSLPKTSAELSAMEKLLELQDSVPCKIRAKRGFATHPRSIAERVRRTRISERMRKLQELVPNMDKQTNTADMLDLAVDYIKDLQKHVKTLSDNRAKCTCSDQQKR